MSLTLEKIRRGIAVLEANQVPLPIVRVMRRRHVSFKRLLLIKGTRHKVRQ